MASDTSNAAPRSFGAVFEIIEAHQQGRPPNARAIEIMADAFQTWLDEDGHKTLDLVLGFAAASKGKAPFVQQLRQRQRELFVRHLVAVLDAGGFALSEAAELVSVAINDSNDTLFRKQLRQLGLTPKERAREGKKIDHWPSKSVRELYTSRGGEKWARAAGYFGEDVEERRIVRKLQEQKTGDMKDPDVQTTQNRLWEMEICSLFPFRSVEALRAIIPVEALPRELAAKLRPA